MPPLVRPARTLAAAALPGVRAVPDGLVLGDLRARPLSGRFLAVGLGTRMLALFLALLALWAVVSLALLQNALDQRLDSRVDQELTEEISDFGRLAAVQRPASGQFTHGEVSAGELRFRYLARPVSGAAQLDGVIVVLSSVGREHREIDDAVKVTGVAKFVLLVVAALLAWLLARRLLAPVSKLTEAARNATESDLTQRIPTTSGRDEVAELARTFNAMLDRLEAAFASQRRFLNDAGHELRMPLAVVMGHLELVTDDPEDRRQTMELVKDELGRMDRIVDELLTLAKAERPDFLWLEPVQTDALLEEVLDKVRPLARRDWRFEGTASEPIAADKQRMVQAVMNLVDNAMRATREHDTIAIGAAADGDEVRIWVRDTGPGIGLEQRERIFDRFARGPDEPRGDGGSGLGLAIVRAVAEAHRGRVELDSSSLGSTFTLVLPQSVREKVPA